MAYLIDGYIMYSNHGGSITNKDTNDTILLPETASRLLNFLLQHHSATLTRDEILENVWDKYGYKASNNTLSQYISLIRKNLQLLGFYKDLIITVPRIGFFLSNNIDITFIDEHAENSAQNDIYSNCVKSLQDSNTISLNSIKYHHEYSIKQKTKPLRNSSNGSVLNFLSFCIGFTLILTSIIYMYIIYNSTFQKDENLYRFGEIDSCPVYFLHQEPPKTTKTKAVTDFINKYLPCIDGSVYFIQYKDHIIYSEKHHIFVSRCAYPSNSVTIYSSCKSIYYYE